METKRREAPSLVILNGYNSRGEVSAFYLKLETLSTPEVYLWRVGVEQVGPGFAIYEQKEGNHARKNL